MNSSINQAFQTTEMSSTTYWGQKYAYQESLNIVETVISSLSIFGSLTIILTYFIFQDLQTTTRKFLVCISVGDFFTVYPYLIKAWVTDSSTNCITQSFVSTTAVMWSFFWTSSLAIYLYIIIVKKDQERADKLMPYFHLINWGLPLVLVGAVWKKLGSDDSLDSGGWCWIKIEHGQHNEAIWWMLLCGKFWEISSYFVDVILCFIVTRNINAEVNERHSGLSSESTQVALQGKRKLICAPLLFVFLRIWGTIRFVLFCFNPHPKKSWIYEILIICHIVGDSSQGFVYFILFCLLTPKFRALCSCRKKTSMKINCKGRTNSWKNEQHKYLLQNPKSIVFYT